MRTETLTNVIERLENEQNSYIKGTWEYCLYRSIRFVFIHLNECFGLRENGERPYRAKLEKKEELIPFMEDVFEEQWSVRIGQEFSFELMFANAVVNDGFLDEWEPEYFTTGVQMDEMAYLLDNPAPNRIFSEMRLFLHLEDEIFVKYLWLARNSFVYGDENPTEDEIRRYYAIIDRYCREKGVVLDDEGFDYLDITNNFTSYYLLDNQDYRYTAENSKEFVELVAVEYKGL